MRPSTLTASAILAVVAAAVGAAGCANGQAIAGPVVTAAPPAAPPAASPVGPALAVGTASARIEATRAGIDAALAQDAEARWRRRRSVVFADAGAVFALDDAWSLLAQAPRPRRGALLAAMAPACARRAAIDAEERARVEAAAAAAGATPSEWYARRVGLDQRALASIVDGVLAATGELLGPVAGDATLVPDVLAPPPWASGRAAAAALAASVTPVSAWAVHYGDVPRPPTADDAAAYARALAVEARLAALSLLALEATPAQRDALASRALLDGAEVLAGASVLLDVDASGAVAERFVGLLRAPGVARARWTGEPLASVVARLEVASPADQEGYPEAFIAVARLLPDTVR